MSQIPLSYLMYADQTYFKRPSNRNTPKTLPNFHLTYTKYRLETNISSREYHLASDFQVIFDKIAAEKNICLNSHGENMKSMRVSFSAWHHPAHVHNNDHIHLRTIRIRFQRIVFPSLYRYFACVFFIQLADKSITKTKKGKYWKENNNQKQIKGGLFHSSIVRLRAGDWLNEKNHAIQNKS